MRNATVVLAVAVVVMFAVAVPAYGATYGFAVSSGYWDQDTSWSTSLSGGTPPAGPPAAGDTAYVIWPDQAVCTVRYAATVGCVEVGHISFDSAHLVIGLPSLTDVFECFGDGTNAYGNNGRVFVGGKSDIDCGSITLNQGTFECEELNAGSRYGGYGKFTINGGKLSVAYVGGADHDGDGAIYVGDSSGNTSNSGVFEVIGSAADSITADGYVQVSTSALNFAFGGGSDPIQQIDIDGDAALAGTLTVTGTASATGGPNNDGVYTLMTYTSLSSTYADINVTLPDASWSWNATGDATTPGALTVTVPEPATMVLLGIGGIGVLLRRKRR